MSKGILVIDSREGVFGEYRKYLSFSGQPGMGDLFFKWMVDNRYRHDRVVHVPLTPHPERQGEYIEFPQDPELEGFDRSDRIFVALACAHPERPTILNAVDSDYWHYRDPLTRNGVNVMHSDAIVAVSHQSNAIHPTFKQCPTAYDVYFVGSPHGGGAQVLEERVFPQRCQERWARYSRVMRVTLRRDCCA